MQAGPVSGAGSLQRCRLPPARVRHAAAVARLHHRPAAVAERCRQGRAHRLLHCKGVVLWQLDLVDVDAPRFPAFQPSTSHASPCSQPARSQTLAKPYATSRQLAGAETSGCAAGLGWGLCLESQPRHLQTFAKQPALEHRRPCPARPCPAQVSSRTGAPLLHAPFPGRLDLVVRQFLDLDAPCLGGSRLERPRRGHVPVVADKAALLQVGHRPAWANARSARVQGGTLPAWSSQGYQPCSSYAWSALGTELHRRTVCALHRHSRPTSTDQRCACDGAHPPSRLKVAL